MPDEQLGLAEAIQSIRAELRRAQQLGQEKDVRFVVGDVEVEFAVEITKEATGGGSVKVLNLVSLEAKGGLSKAETNRIKVTLKPIGVGGISFEVASAQQERPDGASA